MRPFPVLLACFLAAISGSAQQNQPAISAPASPNSPAAQFRKLPQTMDVSCPVSLHVGHTGLVYLYNAEQQTWPPAKTPAQSIEINLINLRAEDVVAVDAHVQGVPGVPHFSLMPVTPHEGGIVTTTKPDGTTKKQAYGTAKVLPPPVSFHAGLHMSPYGNATLEWTLENAGGVQWVQIDRIVYADGSEWLRSQSQSCKMAPDPMVLVK